MRLAIITPSYIHSDERIALARQSLASLRGAAGEEWPLIVVDDIPRGRGRLSQFLPNRRYLPAAAQLYRGANIRLIRRYGRSSTAAARRAVHEARRMGCDLAFIHLDDHVYIPALGALLRHATDAFERDAELMEVRLSAYPIISRTSTPELGNRADLAINGDEIAFDTVHLQPTRYDGYTLWWSYFQPEMVEGRFWPVIMWFVVYRADFLEHLLSFGPAASRRGLSEVESYYQNKANWQALLQRVRGKLGYINMQFGGIEMHHNRDYWRDLIRLPNVAVR